MDNVRVQPTCIYFEESNISNNDNISENRLFGYEESDYILDDTDDDNNLVNINEVTLKIGDLFNDWESVQTVIDSYAKQNGFVANKCRKDVDPIDKSIIRRRVYTCWKSGIHKSKKVENISLHRECTSYKTNCPWQANFYFGKSTDLIRLTKFEQEHNHQCDSKTIELAPKNLRFPQQILDKVEHYTTNGHLGAEQQYKLLVQEFPQHNIRKKNLYNAIQQFRGVRIHDETDAATMLLYLLKQRENDSDYIVIPRLEGPANELTGLFWMTSQQCIDLWPKFHDVIIYDTTSKTNRYEMALSLFVAVDNNYKTRIVAQALTKYENQADFNWIFQCILQASNNLPPKVLFTDSDPAIIAAVQIVYPQTRHLLCIYHLLENVKKKAKAKLRGDMAKSFITDFYIMRNSHSKEQFDLKYREMLTKYEPCQSYLENRLYSSRRYWARYEIAKIFTAGIESTQRVESINGIIKKMVDRGTLLKELVKAIENELDKEAQYTRIKDYYGANPSVGLPSTYNTIFKELDSLLQELLSPIPLSLQRAQMKQSLLYQATLISINQVIYLLIIL
jgi:MULE transposase domain/FAR1 DNA-binding domain